MQIERGKVLAGRYRIEGRLGHGAMGSVWRARDTRLDRSVAVKLAAASPSSSSSPGQARRRLRREAEALAALSEPRIARVYDLVEADLDVCLVMELVEGESLAARLNRQPRIPAAEALEIAAQCAQALEAAHRIGIVHRDVKPSNIMLGPDGVKVVDFGIAAHIGPSCADTTATMPRQIIGTAAYLAPERALGAQAGTAADFYSLGVVLYQMLAGHLPFRADESLAMLYAHTRKTPEPLPADVPSPAALLCMRLLSKTPERRPTTAEEIDVARTHVLHARAATMSRARKRRRAAKGAPTETFAFETPADVPASASASASASTFADEAAAGAAAAAAWLGTKPKRAMRAMRSKPSISVRAQHLAPAGLRRGPTAHASQTRTDRPDFVRTELGSVGLGQPDSPQAEPGQNHVGQADFGQADFTSVGFSDSDARRANHPKAAAAGRRAPVTLLAALSSTAAALAAATAWILLEQPASAGAATPVAAPTSSTAPATAVPSVTLPPTTANQSAHSAVPVSISKPKAPTSHSAPAKPQAHKPAKHEGGGHDGHGGPGGGGPGDGGDGGD